MQIGKGKQGVRIGEYEDFSEGLTTKVPSDGNAVIGWIEPAGDCPQWILWFTSKGDAILHRKRSYSGSDTGAVLDKPLNLKGHDPSVRPKRKLATKV